MYYPSHQTNEAPTGEVPMNYPQLRPAVAVAAQPAPNVVYVQQQGSVLRPIQKEDEKPASISQWVCQSIILTGILLVFCLVAAAWGEARVIGGNLWHDHPFLKGYQVAVGYFMTAGSIVMLFVSLVLIVSSMIAQCLANYKLSHNLSMIGSVVYYFTSVIHIIAWITFFAELFEHWESFGHLEPVKIMIAANVFMILVVIADVVIRVSKLGPL